MSTFYFRLIIPIHAVERESATMTEKTPEERIAALEAELASLRKPVPRTEPLHKTLPGQAGLYDQLGNRVHLSEIAPASTTVGGGSFGVYRTNEDGSRVYAPDGVPRSRETGEALTQVRYEDRPIGPARTHAHQAHIELVDKLFPIQRPSPTED